MTGFKKLEHIWEYYKLHIIIICILAYIAGYFCFRMITKTEPDLYIAFVNVNLSEENTDKLTTDYNENCKVYNNMFLASNPSSENYEYAYASRIKLLSAIDAQKLDVVFMNKEVLDAFMEKGYLLKLDDVDESYLYNDYSILANNLPALSQDELTEDMYVGFIANTSREEEVARYISYLSSNPLPQ